MIAPPQNTARIMLIGRIVLLLHAVAAISAWVPGHHAPASIASQSRPALSMVLDPSIYSEIAICGPPAKPQPIHAP